MSTGAKLSYTRMMPIAQSVAARLAVNCQRLEIAGSLRRKKDTIGDVEIVAVPTDALYTQLDELLEAGKIRHAATKRWGQKLRSFLFDTKSGNTIQVDLFLQPDPATWGINYMIRTGSKEFSHRMVTARKLGGWMPDMYRVHEARVWLGLDTVPTPNETDVFRLWGMDYVPPTMRTADYTPGTLRQAIDFTLDDVPELAQAPDRLIEAPAAKLDAASIVARFANEPLPVFPGGAAAAARAAIEASEHAKTQGAKI
jgi:DNA polymerase (family 10)